MAVEKHGELAVVKHAQELLRDHFKQPALHGSEL
jgi:hypothetical protein